MLTPTLALLLATTQNPVSTPVVRGVVRADDSGEPVIGALVRVLDEDARAYSDSTGAYVITLARTGTHRVRVSRTGFVPLVLDMIAGVDTTRIDVALTASPLGLPAIAILGVSGTAGERPQRATDEALAIGSRSFTASRLRDQSITSNGDPISALASVADVSARGGASALRVRGGSTDQNAVLLDGVPIFNPYHGGGGVSAVSPDIVSKVTLHAGVPPAQFGNATSGIVVLETDTTSRRRLAMRGALSESMVRQLVEGPIPLIGGSFTVSARRSLTGLLGSNGGVGAIGSSASFGDAYAKVTRRLAGGRFDAFGLASGDALAFDARSRVASTTITSPIADVELARNRFDWKTRTTAFSWASNDSAATRWGIRGWRTDFSSGAAWAADSGPVRMLANLGNTGFGVSARRTFGSVALDAGAEAQRIGSRYSLTPMGSEAPIDSARAELAMSGQLGLTSFFVEGAWSASPSWSFRAGLREQAWSFGWRAPEPRLIARFAPTSRVAFSAGYSRALQDVQSLRNEESLMDAVFGVTLPVMSKRRRIRQATSDQLTGGVQWQLSETSSFHADAYGRWLRGLVLVPLATQQPFAMSTSGTGAGRGRARGIVTSFDHEGERFQTQLSYGASVTERSEGSLRYRPGAGATHALKAAAGYRVLSHTSMRVAVQTEGGRAGNLFAGRLRWAPWSSPDGGADLQGSPQRYVGGPGSRRLRQYTRVDVGIRHEWQTSPLGLFGAPGRIAAVAGVSNVLARRNALGLLRETDDAPLRTLPMEPRALRLRFEWGQ